MFHYQLFKFAMADVIHEEKITIAQLKKDFADQKSFVKVEQIKYHTSMLNIINTMNLAHHAGMQKIKQLLPETDLNKELEMDELNDVFEILDSIYSGDIKIAEDKEQC